MSIFGHPICWICCGKGYLVGPLYTEPCPNEHCPHKSSPAGVAPQLGAPARSTARPGSLPSLARAGNSFSDRSAA